MSKKRGKSAAGSAGGAKWESAIVSTPLNEDEWWLSSSMVVANKTEDNDIIDFLSSAISTGQRRLFNVVSRTELLKLVVELGNPKVKKGKEVPANFEVCEAAKPYLDANEDIPLPLMAKLVKFKLLDLKAADQKRRDAVGKKSPEKGKGKGKEKGSAGKERGKSAKKGGGKKTPEPPSGKNESKLRKRGEEDPDAKYIDDEPDDGAKKYVILTGFDNPLLLHYLADVGVPLDSVIKLRAQDYDLWREKIKTDPQHMAALSNMPGSEEDKKMKECDAKIQLAKFWRDVTMVLRKFNNLKDICLMEYEVKHLLFPLDMEDNEKKMEFGMHLYEDIACLMYDLLDAKRQWHNYAEKMHLLTVPDEVVPLSPKSEPEEPASEERPQVDMRFYQDVLKGLPQETISVETIVHAMLDQVEATEQEQQPPSELVPPQRADHVDHGLAGHLAKLVLRLPLSAEEVHKLESDLLPKMPSLQRQRMTMLVHPLDDISMRSIGVDPTEEIDPKKAEFDLLYKMEPYANLLRFPDVSPELMRKRAARLQEMIHFCSMTEMGKEEIDRAFKQFVFESLQITCTDPSGYIMQPHHEDLMSITYPWDDPYPFFKTLRDIVRDEITPPWAQSKRSSSASLARSRTPEPPSSSEGSRPPSILKRSASAGSSPDRSRKSSVHFESEAMLKSVRDCPPAPAPPAQENEEVMKGVEECQQRQLDEWCFMEHLQSHVFLQILKSATHQLPYIDTYYHKRDHTLMVVLHNPHQSELLSNHVQWQHWLHADVGFRSYLDNVSESIRDWTTEQEAKYEAEQLRKEVESAMLEDEEAKKKEAAGAKGKRDRSKSPKKGGKGARSRSGSRPSSAERSDGDNFLIREGSLKAQKVEMDRIAREKEEEERKKQEKRARSAQKRAEKEAAEKAAKEKRPSSKGSAKSRKSRSPSAEPTKEKKEDKEEKEEEPKPFWPFVGYNLGDDLVHVSGEITTLFPTDGGTIRTERTDFVRGTTHVRTCVLKDNHVFSIHVEDPVREVTSQYEAMNAEISELKQQKKDIETALLGPDPGAAELNDVIPDASPSSSARQAVQTEGDGAPPVSFYGSFTARFSDNLFLSLSAYGDRGSPIGVTRPQPESYTPPPTRPASTEVRETTSKGKNRKDKSPTPAPVPETAREEDVSGAADGSGGGDTERAEDTNEATSPRFQKLFVSTPDGAQLQYMLESQAGAVPLVIGADGGERRLLVKMRRCDTAAANGGGEVSRLVTCEGIVMRLLEDGRTQVLYPDGTAAECCPGAAPEPVAPPEAADSSPRHNRAGTGKSTGRGDESPSRKTHDKTITWNNSQKSLKSDQDAEAPVAAVPDAVWTITGPNGERSLSTGGNLSPLLVTIAADPLTGQEVYTRADRTLMVHWPETESYVVEHADGTRISSFGLWQPAPVAVDAETGEEDGGANPNMEVQRFVRVECPGHAAILINIGTGEMETRFGREGGTVLLASPLGVYHMHHCEGGQMTIHEDGTCLYTGRPSAPETSYLQSDGLPTYAMRHSGEVVCEVVDPDGNLFSVDVGGSSHVMLARGEGEEETAPPAVSGPGRRLQRFQQHAPRFFVIHPDGSATEFLRYQDIAGYISAAERDPTSAVLSEELQDCPRMTGISVIRPIRASLPEQWRTVYAKDSVVPAGLKARDLKTLPPEEAPKPGPQFGTNVGRSLAIGSLPKPEPPPLAPKCPSMLEFRQFVQCRPIQAESRDALKDQLQKFAEYVQDRETRMEAAEPIDPRSEEERVLAGQLLARAAAVRAQLQIDNIADAYEKATAPPPPPIPPTPQPRRTEADWERDRLARVEEKENKAALKEKYVPNYFLSEFGKDFVLSQAKSVKSFSKELNVFPESAESSARRSAKVNGKVEPHAGLSPQEAAAKATGKSLRPSHTPHRRTEQPALRSDGPVTANTQAEFPYFDSNYEVTPSLGPGQPPDSLKVDVNGEPRRAAVRLPSYLFSGRPGYQGPNVRQATVEDPVRRRILTSSVVGGSLAQQLGVRRMRGLNVLPTRVDFGLLREGYTYRRTLLLRNTGVETCRFKVRQPPLATGIRLFFRPGPIPPGLAAEILIEVYAIAAGVQSGQSGVGLVEHQLQVITETDVLHVPIAVRVMTAHAYDKQPDLNIASEVKLVAKGAPVREGIIRPRRKLD